MTSLATQVSTSTVLQVPNLATVTSLPMVPQVPNLTKVMSTPTVPQVPDLPTVMSVPEVPDLASVMQVPTGPRSGPQDLLLSAAILRDGDPLALDVASVNAPEPGLDSVFGDNVGSSDVDSEDVMGDVFDVAVWGTADVPEEGGGGSEELDTDAWLEEPQNTDENENLVR